MDRISGLGIALLITLALGTGSAAAAQRYDIVIEGGTGHGSADRP